MSAFALSGPVPSLSDMPDRALRPRAPGQRPRPTTPLAVPDLRALKIRRRRINETAVDGEGENPLQVVLYALAGPDEDVHDQLAVARGCAAAHALVVVNPPIVDTLDYIDARTGGDDPLLRRGYTQAMRMITGPGPVRGVVAASHTTVSAALYVYDAQLTWYADHRAGLWLARGETDI